MTPLKGATLTDKKMPEWAVLLIIVVACAGAASGSWVGGFVAAALFGLFYYGLSKFRARRAPAKK